MRSNDYRYFGSRSRPRGLSREPREKEKERERERESHFEVFIVEQDWLTRLRGFRSALVNIFI